MFHSLTVGHLDEMAAREGRNEVVRGLDMHLVINLLRDIGEVDDEGFVWFHGYPVEIGDGYVTCPWLMPRVIRKTEEFIRRLHATTGCTIADIGCHALLDVREIR